MHAAALLSAAVKLRTDRRPARLCAAPTRCPLQEFLLEVQTSSGGSGPAAVSQIALILAQQLEQRRDDPAAQLTALRWEGVFGGGWVVRDTWQRQVAAARCDVEPAAPLLLHESNTDMELHWCSHALLQLPADHPPTLPACPATAALQVAAHPGAAGTQAAAAAHRSTAPGGAALPGPRRQASSCCRLPACASLLGQQCCVHVRRLPMEIQVCHRRRFSTSACALTGFRAP